MQKIINLMAISSFIVSVGIVGGGYHIYTQKDAYIESAKENITKEIQGIIEGVLVDSLNSSVPEVPGVTEVPSTEGNTVPSIPF